MRLIQHGYINIYRDKLGNYHTASIHASKKTAKLGSKAFAKSQQMKHIDTVRIKWYE